MPSTRVVIIGAGQAGLAVSYLLTAASIDHLVLERGRTAERWRSQRWNSLRLLTPNWMTRLPGWSYRGADPDGFMPAPTWPATLAATPSRSTLRCGAIPRCCRFAGTVAGTVAGTEAGTWSAPTPGTGPPMPSSSPPASVTSRRFRRRLPGSIQQFVR
jgi:putative flavoprotein involved in K+ transport